jgi:hypothetical protein
MGGTSSIAPQVVRHRVVGGRDHQRVVSRKTVVFDTRQRSLHLIFWALAIVGVALFFVPAFIIRPFRYQSPGALHLALLFRQMAPIGTILAACGVLGLAVWAWKSAGRLQKILMAAAALLVVGSATMAPMNYFEWMFHPVQQPGFEKADDAKLDAGEMVLTVSINGDARAYPFERWRTTTSSMMWSAECHRGDV